jgi:hypothetical protein
LSGIAAAVAIKTCHRFDRAHIQRFPEHVMCRCPPTAWVCAIISQHCLLRTNIGSRPSCRVFRELRIVSSESCRINSLLRRCFFLPVAASSSARLL